MGQRSKLTPEVQDRIIEALTLGAYQEIAARYAGISERTFYRWMQEGEQATRDGPKRRFWQAVRETQTKLEIELGAIIRRAAQKDWHAANEFLKRRFGERWGTTTRLVGADGGPVRIVSNREEAVKQGRERAKHLRAV